jgi:hypothetical protein
VSRGGWPTVLLQIALALTGGTVGVAIAGLAGNPVRGPQVVFLATFGVCLPGGFVAGAWLADRLRRRSPEHLALLAGVAAGGLLAAVLVARLVYALGGPASVTLLAGCVASVVVTSAVAALPPARPPARAARAACAAVGLLVPLAVVAFLPSRLLRPGPLAISLGGALVVALLLSRRRAPRLAGPLGVAADAGLLALAALWVVDVAAYLPSLPYDPFAVFHHAGDINANDKTFAMVAHHDFYLAPVNDVLHGRPVLVETYSQYGTGVLYFLAAFFHVAPLGYGGLALLAGTLAALQFSAGFATLRLAGCGRGVAALAVAVGVVAVSFGSLVSLDYVPSAGGLRYAWGYALLLAAVAATRWPRRRRALAAAQLAIVAVASVWSLETFVVVAVTFAAVTAVAAATGPGAWPARLRRWGIDLLRAASVSVAALGLFALITLALTGSRPHLRPYLAFFGIYSSGQLNLLGVPSATPWAPGVAVGALYLASAAGIAALVRGRSGWEAPRPWLVALVGLTAFGAASFTYWVTHPDPRSLAPLALPAILMVALWLERARGARPALGRVPRGAAFALGGWVAALLVVFAWPQAERDWKRTAFGHALPGAPSLVDDVRTLWRSPRIDPRTAEAERLLRRYLPGRGPALVLLEPDLTVETLVRARRVNRLPVGDLIQDDLIRAHRLPRIARAIQGLRPGTRMLVQIGIDPRVNLIERSNPLRDTIMAMIRQRFDLRPVATGGDGLSVVELVPHGAPAA